MFFDQEYDNLIAYAEYLHDRDDMNISSFHARMSLRDERALVLEQIKHLAEIQTELVERPKKRSS